MADPFLPRSRTGLPKARLGFPSRIVGNPLCAPMWRKIRRARSCHPKVFGIMKSRCDEVAQSGPLGSASCSLPRTVGGPCSSRGPCDLDSRAPAVRHRRGDPRFRARRLARNSSRGHREQAQVRAALVDACGPARTRARRIQGVDQTDPSGSRATSSLIDPQTPRCGCPSWIRPRFVWTGSDRRALYNSATTRPPSSAWAVSWSFGARVTSRDPTFSSATVPAARSVQGDREKTLGRLPSRAAGRAQEQAISAPQPARRKRSVRQDGFSVARHGRRGKEGRRAA